MDRLNQHVTRLLRIWALVIAEPMTSLTNHLIANCTWPTVWKNSNASPIYKKSDETVKVNCWPVSILTTLSKYEKVIFDQIYGCFSYKLSPNLSDYLRGQSCCTALLKKTEDWRASLDRRKEVAAVAIDLSKAFDSVCQAYATMFTLNGELLDQGSRKGPY